MRIGPLELEERLARGGMAEVWRGRVADDVDDDDLHVACGVVPRGIPLCIKRLDPAVVQDVDFVEMFRDEARLALILRHEHVVRTWALVDDNPGGQPTELLLVMELIDGTSLAHIASSLRRTDPPSPLTPTEALGVGLRLARALHYVHTANDDDDGSPLGIVHRDISPHNVMLGRDGRLVLIDFGVARAAARLTRTRAGTLKGKAAYMAPEQVRGDAVDARTDQFAWGAVLWELLCGRPLFAGADELRVLNRIERPEVTPPSAVTDLTQSLTASASDVDRVVLRALAVRPGDRFPDMARAAAAVASLLGPEPPSLVSLAKRGLDAVSADVAAPAPVARTRIVGKGRQAELAREDTIPPVGQVPRRPRELVVGAMAVGVLLVLAVLVARPSAGPGPTTLSATVATVPTAVVDDGLRARARALESRLRPLPPHPCRLALEEELQRTRTLTAAVVDGVEADLVACTAAIVDAPRAQQALAALHRTRPLVPPPSRKATPASRDRRLLELKRRTRLALDAGDVDASVILAEAAASQAPADPLCRANLFEAYRRAGTTASAGVEARALIRMTGDDSGRYRRWLSDHGLPASSP